MTCLKKKPELLMPAGSLDVLKVAVNYGADAVYIGGDLYGLRAKAHNFGHDEMAEGIEYCHRHNAKLYVTVNITAHNYDLEGIKEYLIELDGLRPDGLIISDPGVFSLAAELAPHVERHISTQANSVNYLDYLFWWKLGAKRVVNARELSLAEIAEIRQHIPEEMEIESFIHGAMCISYSGRCLLSNYLAGRDANLGECTHPCRWKYFLNEETRPGEYMPVEENERGTFIFNSKDLCMIDHLPLLIEAGINSFKVEGRMKTALYVATVARAYRMAIDDYFEDPSLYESNKAHYFEEITKCTNRHFTTGFYFGKPSAEAQIYDSSTYVKDYVFYGAVERSDRPDMPDEAGFVSLEQKNKFCVGDVLEEMKPTGENIRLTVEAIYDGDGNPMESCPHAKQRIYVKFSKKPECGNLLRSIKG